jgi:hypothetical protein
MNTKELSLSFDRFTEYKMSRVYTHADVGGFYAKWYTEELPYHEYDDVYWNIVHECEEKLVSIYISPEDRLYNQRRLQAAYDTIYKRICNRKRMEKQTF